MNKRLKDGIKMRKLREGIRKMIEQELEELTGSGAAGGYATPYAFATKKPASSKKDKNDLNERFKALLEATPLTEDHASYSSWKTQNAHKRLRKQIEFNADELQKAGRRTDADNLRRAARKFFNDSDSTMLRRTRETSQMMLRQLERRSARRAAERRTTQLTDERVTDGWIVKYSNMGKPEKTPAFPSKDKARKSADFLKLQGATNIRIVQEAIIEGGDPYYAWRNDETLSPRQKIGKAIGEINGQLSEMDKLVRRSIRLKKEMGIPSSNLWKRTNNALMKIESRIHKMAQRVRAMRD